MSIPNDDHPSKSLVDRFPHVAASELISGFVPPPQFSDESFDTYVPDPKWESQSLAVSKLRELASQLNSAVGQPAKKSAFGISSRAKKRRLERRNTGSVSRGVYLDGGFGVGKTHLLAALYRSAPLAVFGSFVEYTNLVGALGFDSTVEELSRFDLVCIDEFELDDPGDTVLVSSLLSQLVDRGVYLAATSNTLPDKLGDGRFAADDFLREIQSLANQFEVVRIDGDDYRHRDLASTPKVASPAELDLAAQAPKATRDSFGSLLVHLAKVHPSQFGAMVEGVDVACVDDVFTVEDQSQALRFVALVDRLYDEQVKLVASGVPIDQVFSDEMLAGGFRKKYRRALSRLNAMADFT